MEIKPMEARELTLRNWRYRRGYPAKDLPGDIVLKLIGLPSGCPLCSLFGESDCRGCPLVIDLMRCGAGVFKNWSEAYERKDWDAASYFAGEIVKAVERWGA
jgi:hypothetical protein